MKLPFFRNDDSEIIEASKKEAIETVGNAELRFVLEDGDLVLAPYEHASYETSEIGGAEFFDAMIPAAVGIADAVSQYDYAIVRFPEGVKWKDLLDRKTPGWEEWKQITPFKDGKFQPQAAIKQVKVSPTAVANIVLQGAAIAVGQSYMTEINKQLEAISVGVASIQQEMRIEREAKIEASFEMLREYAMLYGEICQNPEKKQAVLNGIEGIRKDVREAWMFQMKSIAALNQRLFTSKRMKSDLVRANIREFQSRDNDVLTVFKLLVAAEQTSMQYDADFSTARIEREREQMLRRLNEYEDIRSGVQGLLKKHIGELRGDLLAIPALGNDDYKPQNPFFDFAHAAAANFERLTPLALRKEANKQLKDKKRRYGRSVSADNPIATIVEGCEMDLESMDFIYNQANTVIIDRSGVHFLKQGKDGADGTLERPMSKTGS